MAKTEYLLPCTCGEKVPVDRSQAGLTVRCHCGKELTIPTLRGFAQLERADASGAKPARIWGLRQGIMFTGAAICVLGLIATGLFWITRPQYPTEQVDALLAAAGSTADLDSLTPQQLSSLWTELRPGPDAGMPPGMPQINALMYYYGLHIQTYQRLMTVALSIAIIGVVVLVAGLLVPSSRGAGRLATASS